MINKSGMPLREQFNLWPRRDASHSFSFFLVPHLFASALTRRVNPLREGQNELLRVEHSAALLSALTALQIRIANGPFPQALTLNVNCCLNLWQPVLLLSFSFPIPSVFSPVDRLSIPPHSNRITTAIHCEWRSRETSPMISDSGIGTKCRSRREY